MVVKNTKLGHSAIAANIERIDSQGVQLAVSLVKFRRGQLDTVGELLEVAHHVVDHVSQRWYRGFSAKLMMDMHG